MTLRDPLWMEDAEYNGDEDRQLIQTMFAEGAFGDGLEVTERAAGTNMSVDVSAGACVIDGDDVAGQGAYFCKSTAVENVTLSAAPGVGKSRIDRIIAQVRDGTVLGSGPSDWIITKVTGTPGGSPSAPALPDSAISLALVEVGSGVVQITDNDITDDRGTSAGVSTFSLADNAVTNDKLANGAVNAAALGVNAVDSDNIINGAVGTDELENLAVTTGKLANEAVTEGKLGALAVTTAKLAADSVTGPKIVDGTIGSAKISDEAWTNYTAGTPGITVGNGTLVTRYMKRGRVVHVRFRLNVGSTTTFSPGSGGYINLPFDAQMPAVGPMDVGSVVFHDDSTSRNWIGACGPNEADPGALDIYQPTSGDAGYLDDDSPFTFSADCWIAGSITYEAAA